MSGNKFPTSLPAWSPIATVAKAPARDCESQVTISKCPCLCPRFCVLIADSCRPATSLPFTDSIPAGLGSLSRCNPVSSPSCERPPILFLPHVKCLSLT